MAKGCFESLVGRGENPSGIVQETANGTITNGCGGDGYNFPTFEFVAPETPPRVSRNSVRNHPRSK